MHFSKAPDGSLLVDDLFAMATLPSEWTPVVSVEGEGRLTWTVTGVHLTECSVSAELVADSTGLQARTEFRKRTKGVWVRQDVLTNAGTDPIALTRCLSRLVLASGIYKAYSQDSRWCHENQGRWEQLSHGQRMLCCFHGRTSQGGTPYAVIRKETAGRALALHIEPQGNWIIRLRTPQGMGDTLPTLAVEAGLSDDDLALPLAPGDTLALPPLLIQDVPGATPEKGAPLLHEALLQERAVFPKPVPLVYNTWFDVFDKLDVDRLRSQLAAARDVGCEVFVIDAGWYGVADGWACQGDWREKQDRAFRGRMQAFADEVRAAGLAFGLWMEPETIQPHAPIASEHPEWFLPGIKTTLWPDLENPDAYSWVQGEMRRLLGTYGVRWIKIDFNQPIGPDPRGKQLYGYYEKWYSLLDELRREFPDTFFENCTSGGLRLDLRTLRHYHGQFISDTVHPVDTLRILQGALLRCPPGPLYSWTILRPAGPTIPEYGKPFSEAAQRILTPQGATWADCETTDLDFAVAASFPGIIGFGGDLAGLTPDQHARIRQWADAWKDWRDWMQTSVAEMLTPPKPIEDRGGWTAIQLRQSEDSASHLLFVYRCHDPRANHRIRPVRLAPERTYRVKMLPDGEIRSLSGAELTARGLDVTIARPNQARIFSLEEQQ